MNLVKNCPFCGRPPRTNKNHKNDSGPRFEYNTVCINPHCRVAVIAYGNTADDAEATWNARQEGDPPNLHDIKEALAGVGAQLGRVLAYLGTPTVQVEKTTPDAYICGTCGQQWYEGIQNDCGHKRNEIAYARPIPCKAVKAEEK